MIAKTPKPPYYSVIFSSITSKELEGYTETAQKMITLAQSQHGFLGVESARNEIGITVSYWKDLESIQKWKSNYEHSIAQEKGKSEWYSSYKVRIAKVEHDYDFNAMPEQR